MTRQQAAARLRKLASLRDAREACEMGAAALAEQATHMAVALVTGFVLGVIVGALV